ncbi:uncharacterized protein LOC132740166 [Ruditapes philippinarum]|uniref:uncharacterized protein LOC132740166 n=1 Tax=Ruditapes philippinarum TaxID=129788 RepID=UPI00295BAC37|nr:uncharacterized protein LOC132740166 [Ruditapes philippinarum]
MESKFLVFDEHCFPRINYFKTRLIRFYPRMKNVLDFEFTFPGRGLKKMRSDDTERDTINELINQGISVECRSIDNALLNAITEQSIAIKPEYLQKGAQQKHGELSKSIASLIVTTEKDLEETARHMANAIYSDHIVLAVFVEDANIRPELNSLLEGIKLPSDQKVVVKLNFANRGDPTTPTPNARKSRKLQGEQVLKSDQSASSKFYSFSDWRESKESTKSPPRSRSISPRRRRISPSNYRSKTRQRSLSQSSHSDSDTPESSSPSPKHNIRQKSKSKKQKTDESSSSTDKLLYVPAKKYLATLPSSCTSSSPVTSSVSTRMCDVSPSRHHMPINQEPMDVEDSEECHRVTRKTRKEHDDGNVPCTIQPGPISFENIDKLDSEALKSAVSLQLETYLADIIERIIKLLKAVRDRRDSNAKVENVTTLDKLIYEIEGLLGQSITKKGVKMKSEIEQTRLPPRVTQDLLRVDGVYGCGTIYSRLNVHIEVKTENDRAKVEENIRKVVTEKHEIQDYVVNVVKSRPALYGSRSLVVCH